MMHRMTISKALLIAISVIFSVAPLSAQSKAGQSLQNQKKGHAMFHALTDDFSVSPQILLDDIADAKAQGVTLIVNNRPDGEDPEAPQGEAIAAAAHAAGIDYVAIPVTHAGFSAPQVDAMIAAFEHQDGGKILAYCRSGTRSTMLWALARAKLGQGPDELRAIAAREGYDLSPIMSMLDTLSGQASGD